MEQSIYPNTETATDQPVGRVYKTLRLIVPATINPYMILLELKDNWLVTTNFII